MPRFKMHMANAHSRASILPTQKSLLTSFAMREPKYIVSTVPDFRLCHTGNTDARGTLERPGYIETNRIKSEPVPKWLRDNKFETIEAFSFVLAIWPKEALTQTCRGQLWTSFHSPDTNAPTQTPQPVLLGLMYRVTWWARPVRYPSSHRRGNRSNVVCCS